MKITEVHLFKVSLTSHETYYLADGKSCDSVDSMALTLHTDTGLTGWGEVCPIPHYLPKYANGVPSDLQELEPINVFDLSGYVTPRLDNNGPTRADGTIRVSERPGHGVTPDPDVLGKPVLSPAL